MQSDRLVRLNVHCLDSGGREALYVDTDCTVGGIEDRIRSLFNISSSNGLSILCEGKLVNQKKQGRSPLGDVLGWNSSEKTLVISEHIGASRNESVPLLSSFDAKIEQRAIQFIKGIKEKNQGLKHTRRADLATLYVF